MQIVKLGKIYVQIGWTLSYSNVQLNFNNVCEQDLFPAACEQFMNSSFNIFYTTWQITPVSSRVMILILPEARTALNNRIRSNSSEQNGTTHFFMGISLTIGTRQPLRNVLFTSSDRLTS